MAAIDAGGQDRPAPVPRPGLFGSGGGTVALVIAVLLAFVSLGPLLYMLSLSFQANGDFLGSSAGLVPTHPTVQNYVQAWTENSFGHYFVNSLVVAIATVVITVLWPRWPLSPSPATVSPCAR